MRFARTLPVAVAPIFVSCLLVHRDERSARAAEAIGIPVPKRETVMDALRKLGQLEKKP